MQQKQQQDQQQEQQEQQQEQQHGNGKYWEVADSAANHSAMDQAESII